MGIEQEQFDYILVEQEKLKALQGIEKALVALASCIKQGKNGSNYLNTDSGYEDY